MYAIISECGRQYQVREGQQLDIDFRDVHKGDKLQFERVLAVGGDGGFRLGKPTIDGASVSATVIGPQHGEKLVVQKLRRRKNSRRKTGHRQLYTRVQIDKIQAG